MSNATSVYVELVEKEYTTSTDNNRETEQSSAMRGICQGVYLIYDYRGLDWIRQVEGVTKKFVSCAC